MFDIGFWELMLIGIMGLIILGPERLPVAIRTVRGWISGARKLSETVKTELTEELRIHELHENLKKAEQGDMSNLSPEISASLQTLKEAAASVNEPFKKIDTTAIDTMVSSALTPHDMVGNESSADLVDNVEHNSAKHSNDQKALSADKATESTTQESKHTSKGANEK